MKEGDMVVSNGKYADIQRRFGDTPHKVVAIGTIPSCNKQMVWLDCGGGGFMADGFHVVDPETDKECWMKHKYTFTISEVAVKKDTPQLVAAVVKRHKCELLGSRRDKSNDMQFGVSAEPRAAKLICRDLSMTNNGEVRMKDYGEDDGKRKAAPKTAAAPETPKPQSKAVRKPKVEDREDEKYVPPIPPIEECFKKWDDIGSPAHKRGVKLLGAGCEVRSMKWWGKFSIDRDHLYAVLYSRLDDDAEFKKYTKENMCEPTGFAAYVATNWVNMRPFVYKVFSKEDAEFIEWHTTHHGRRPS